MDYAINACFLDVRVSVFYSIFNRRDSQTVDAQSSCPMTGLARAERCVAFNCRPINSISWISACFRICVFIFYSSG